MLAPFIVAQLFWCQFLTQGFYTNITSFQRSRHCNIVVDCMISFTIYNVAFTVNFLYLSFANLNTGAIMTDAKNTGANMNGTKTTERQNKQFPPTSTRIELLEARIIGHLTIITITYTRRITNRLTFFCPMKNCSRQSTVYSGRTLILSEVD